MDDGEKRKDKKLSLAPLTFEEAVTGLLQTKPPPKKKGAPKGKKEQPPPKEQKDQK